mmetsp:Transcript_33902/g.49094  ORF Transcript_33902/g.49094 Transcript_33902/m.49094 type:complete len:82 (-) Transcript_33902:383-628(-)
MVEDLGATRNGNNAKTTIGRTVAQVVISSSRTSSIEDTYIIIYMYSMKHEASNTTNTSNPFIMESRGNDNPHLNWYPLSTL